MELVLTVWKPQKNKWFGLRKKSNCGGQFVLPIINFFYGAGGLNDIDNKEKKAEIGLWLLPDFWGMGIMKEAMPLITNYGFNELKLNRIEGFVETENNKCKKAISKLDFQLEKTMKNCEVKNGKLISVDVYAKTNSIAESNSPNKI